MRAHRLVPFLLFAAALLATACENPGGESGPDWPPRGDAVTGDLQQDTVGDQLPQSITVRVVDEDGDPVTGQSVTFVVTAGGGSLFAATATTSGDGVASNRWTLGTTSADTQRVEARMIDPESGQAVVLATFRAVGLADAPTAILALQPVARTGGAGQALADSLQARVVDQHGNPVPGATVVWSVTGGGSISPASGTTNAQGIAKASWTLGTTLLANQAAFASLSPAVRAEFSAVAGIPLGAVLVKVAGDGETAIGGSSVPGPPTVELRTASGVPIANAQVTWSVAAGRVTPALSSTNAAGRASTTWTLPTQPGVHQLTATVQGVAPAVFSATATAGTPANITALAPTTRVGGAGGVLPDSLSVRVTDALGNPVAGVAVSWSVALGGGSVSRATSVTGANGIAKTAWRLGLALRTDQVVNARISPTKSAQFTATVVVPADARLVKVEGDNQTRVVRDSVHLVVELRTAEGQRIINAYVNFVPVEEGTALRPGARIIGPSGQAHTSWYVGHRPGEKHVVATLGTYEIPDVTFTVTVLPGPPHFIFIDRGDRQTAAPGAPLPLPVSVVVYDRDGNRAPGATVTWTVATGGGSVTPVQSQTDATGIARANWTLGPATGQQTLTATVEGLTPVTFKATAQ